MRPTTRLRTVPAVVLDTRTWRAELQDVPAPTAAPPLCLVRTLLTGIDGTDEEVLQGHGQPPADRDTLIMGHEALGEVVEASTASGLAPGDRVVPLVRQGCGECEACVTHHAPDLCTTDDYEERGIKGLDGFLRAAWADPARMLVQAPRELGELAVLTEPLSIACKALEMADRAQRRIPWWGDEGFRGQRALLAGTGSLGTLGAFLLVEQGMEVWAIDRSGDDTAAARLLRGLGVRHVDANEQDIPTLAEAVGGFDLIVEATGAPQVAFQGMQALDKNGVLVLLGVPGKDVQLQVEGSATMKRLVLGNQCVLGSVNSNRRHFAQALAALERFRARWPDELGSVITHRYAPEDFDRALRDSGPGVVKKVVTWT